MPEARQRYYNNDGTLAAGCLLYTYAAGTTTPKATYQDSAGATPHANPIVLDAKGEAVIFWDGSYKVDLKTSAGVQITGYPVDNYRSSSYLADTLRTDLAASTGATLVGYDDTTVDAMLDKQQVRIAHKNFAYDYSDTTIVVRDGSSDTYHRHFGGIAEGIDGRLHLVYRREVEHALTSGGTIYYCKSDDGGETWSAEEQLVAPISGFDQRSMSLCVTPTGRVVLIYDKVVVPSASPTLMRLIYSDDNGETWTQGTDIVSIAFSYARAYGRIKVIPGVADTHYRLAWTPYYQSGSGPSTYKVPVWISNDDGLTWSEGVPIINDTTGYSETELVAVNSGLWFAVSRSTSGLNLWKTVDGGDTWSSIGIVPLALSDNQVAPTLDKFEFNGSWFLALSYCNRATDTQDWRVAPVAAALTSAASFTGAITVASDMVNASGYQSPITKPDGSLYVDGGTAYVEFKEYTGFDYSQVRFVRIDLLALIANNHFDYTVASGEITVGGNALETTVSVDTEGAAATDDLETINGGRPGQTVIFMGPSSTGTRDVTLKSGTGNLDLNGDFTLSTTASRIALVKTNNGRWMEIRRTTEYVPSTITIAAGAITVPNSAIPIQCILDTEGAAATDDLDTINGGQEGQIITLLCVSSSRDITFKDGTGNLNLAGDFTSTNGADRIMLQKQSTTWYEISRSDNA